MSQVATRVSARIGSRSPAVSLAPPPPPAPAAVESSDYGFPLVPSPKKEGPPPTALSLARHVRANSDPLSRGGMFPAGASGQLDQETNPFELGFSALPPSGSQRRARSTSPGALVPGAGTPGGSRLPPVSMMDTPGGILGGLTPFGWPSNSDSLRTGPLSPALLTGPQSSMSANLVHSHAAAASLFTPSTGAAPTTAAVSFPPPSPATAALFAMMTHATPVTAGGQAGVSVSADANAVKAEAGTQRPMAGMEGGGPRPHEGLNEANAFDTSFAQAAHVGPDQRTALQSHFNSQPGPSIAPSQNGVPPMPYGYPPPHSQAPYAPSSLGPGVPPPPAYGGGHNPLYLLSQASQHPQLLPPGQQPPPGYVQQQQGPPRYAHQQPIPQPLRPQQGYVQTGPPGQMGIQDDAVVAAAALSGLGGYGMSPVAGQPALHGAPPGQVNMADVNGNRNGGSPSGSVGSGRGKRAVAATAATSAAKKRKGADAEPVSASPAAKVKAAPAKKGGKKAAPKEEEGSDDEPNEEDMGPPPVHNPNETEEEKRKNFLERNRQAALKCRQRKKAWLASLQTKVESLTTDNESLQATVTHLTDEIASLRAILAAHSNCPTAVANQPHQHQHPQQAY